MKKNFAWIIPILYIIVLLAAGILNTWWPSTDSWIQITEIGLSWPVLSVIFFSSIIFLFEEQIRAFISKVRGIQGENWKVVCQQDSEDSEFMSIETVHNFISYRDSEWQCALDQIAVSAREAIDEVEEEKKKITDHISNIFSEKIFWQFSYANLFLVLRTKDILKLISYREKINLRSFEKDWSQIVPSKSERIAMLNALHFLNFLSKINEDYYITELGQIYVNYLEETGQLRVDA